MPTNSADRIDNEIPIDCAGKDEIIERLLHGASLRTIMVPDESIPTNFPEHVETYHLPHVVINGPYFWAWSGTTHLSFAYGNSKLRLAAFCYTNIGDIFCAYNPDISTIVIMSKHRYRRHDWCIRENYRLVWDSEFSPSTDLVRECIEAGARFTIAMLDSEDIWNIHPVDLPMFYRASKTFELKTVCDNYPSFFRCPPDVRRLIDSHQDILNVDASQATNVITTLSTNFCSFYCLNSDGTYFNFYDIPRKTKQRYKRLKVFAEVMTSEDACANR